MLHPVGPLPTAVYWRRRLLVLVGTLGVLGGGGWLGVAVATGDPGGSDPASGTARLRQRLRLAGGSLQVLAREPTGVRVEASMPVGLLPPEAP